MKSNKTRYLHSAHGKIAIPKFDRTDVLVCQTVKSFPFTEDGKNTTGYELHGIDKVTFWGEHATVLGRYETLEAVEREVSEIKSAIEKGDLYYELKYAKS